MTAHLSGRRTFLAGAIGWLAFGAVHLLAVYHAYFAPPRGAAEANLKAAALQVREKMGPFEPTAWGGIQILNASYSILLLFVGALNLVVLRPTAEYGRLRALTLLNMLLAALLMTVTIIYQFPPPMILAGVIGALFIVSLLRQSLKRKNLDASQIRTIKYAAV
jgi:hypothetical protein